MRKALVAVIVFAVIASLAIMQPAYAGAGYRFLFEPSDEFDKVIGMLPGGYFIVSNDERNFNAGICDSSGRLICPVTDTSNIRMWTDREVIIRDYVRVKEVINGVEREYYDYYHALFDLYEGKRVLEYRAFNFPFEGGKYLVVSNGVQSTVGVVTRSNEVIIPLRYDRIYYLGEDRFVAEYNGTSRVVSADGRILAGPIPNMEIWPAGNYNYHHNIYYNKDTSPASLNDYSEVDLIWAEKDGARGYIDKNLNMIKPRIDIRYQEPTPDFAIIGYKNDFNGLTDAYGNELIPFRYNWLSYIWDGLYLAYVYGEDYNSREYSIIDIKGNVLFSKTCYGITPYFLVDDPGLFRTRDFLDKRNKDHITPVLMVTIVEGPHNNRKVGLFTVDGKTLIPIEYDSLRSESIVFGELGFGLSDDVSKFLDPNAIIAKKWYRDVSDASGDMIFVSDAGLLDASGETIIDFGEYDELDIDYWAPNNYKRVEYIGTLRQKGDEYILGAVNRSNQKVADDYIFSESSSEVKRFYNSIDAMHRDEVGQMAPTCNFSPIDGLFNGYSFSFGPKPTVPALSNLSFPDDSATWSFLYYQDSFFIRGGYYRPMIDVANNRLMYGASYKGRGAVIVFDGFMQSSAQIIEGWERNIEFTVGDANWTFDGAALENDVAPYISGSRTLVPARVIAESLGATVRWAEDENAAYIIKGDMRLKLTVDEPLPGGMGAAALTDNRLFVPLRYIAEKFGGTVEWDPEKGKIKITLK